MNPINRRSFLGRALTAVCSFVVLGTTATLTGCTSFQSILNYVQVGLQAFEAILSILAGAGVLVTPIQAVTALVKAGFADLETAVNDYNAAPAAGKTTLSGKISTAITVLQNEIANFWTSLNLPNGNLAQTISGLLGVIVSTLEGFLTQLPAPAAARAKLPAQISGPAHARSTNQFKADFNKILAANNYSQYALR